MQLFTTDLVLRTVTIQDLDEIARMWNFFDGGVSLEQARQVLDYITGNHARNHAGHLYHLCLAVCRKDAPAIICGWCGLDGKENPQQPEIFVLLQEGFRSKGYGTQCVTALLAYAFGEAGIHRVHGGCDKDNIASARMMCKAGMRHYCDSENGDPLFIAVDSPDLASLHP